LNKETNKEYMEFYGALIWPQDLINIIRMRDEGIISSHGQRVIVDELWKRGRALSIILKQKQSEVLKESNGKPNDNRC